MKEKAIMSWSGGKDSALALHEAQEDFEIVALLTTVTEGYDRISVHGVRTTLLERQADSLKCALEKVVISRTCLGSWPGTSMCETCRSGREVRTARSRFLLCELSLASDDYPKYPPQPVVRCDGYRPKGGVTEHEPGDQLGSPGNADPVQ